MLFDDQPVPVDDCWVSLFESLRLGRNGFSAQKERRQGRQGLQRPVWHDWQVRTLLRMFKIHTKTGFWASNFDDLDPDTLLGCPTGRRKEPDEAN
jgi:hypothetical protein